MPGYTSLTLEGSKLSRFTWTRICTFDKNNENTKPKLKPWFCQVSPEPTSNEIYAFMDDVQFICGDKAGWFANQQRGSPPKHMRDVGPLWSTYNTPALLRMLKWVLTYVMPVYSLQSTALQNSFHQCLTVNECSLLRNTETTITEPETSTHCAHEFSASLMRKGRNRK